MRLIAHAQLLLSATMVATLLMCASCSSLSAVKDKIPDSQSAAGTNQASAAVDNKLIDTWELMYQVNSQGAKEQPRQSTRTLIEFTDTGKVVFNRVERDDSKAVNSRTGKYSVEKDDINVTDDAGNSVKWGYQIDGDTLIITMPELNKKFHWRRYR